MSGLGDPPNHSIVTAEPAGAVMSVRAWTIGDPPKHSRVIPSTQEPPFMSGLAGTRMTVQALHVPRYV